jgi:hypothetical protein
MAISLKDHSDTWVNETTFIHTSHTHLQGPRGIHHTWSVTSQDTAAGKACTPQMEPHQAICSFRLRVLAGRASAPQGSPSQLSEISSFGLRLPGAQSAQEVELSQGLSYSGKWVTLASRGSCRRESLDASICCSWVLEDICCALSRCPLYVIFSCRVFPSDIIYSSADWLHPKVGPLMCCSRLDVITS